MFVGSPSINFVGMSLLPSAWKIIFEHDKNNAMELKLDLLTAEFNLFLMGCARVKLDYSQKLERVTLKIKDVLRSFLPLIFFLGVRLAFLFLMSTPSNNWLIYYHDELYNFFIELKLIILETKIMAIKNHQSWMVGGTSKKAIILGLLYILQFIPTLTKLVTKSNIFFRKYEIV